MYKILVIFLTITFEQLYATHVTSKHLRVGQTAAGKLSESVNKYMTGFIPVVYKNALIVTLFDYEQMDTSAAGRFQHYSTHINDDGSLLLQINPLINGLHRSTRLYRREGNKYVRTDELWIYVNERRGINRNFSVIIEEKNDKSLNIYILKKETGKYVLTQTIEKEYKYAGLSQDGSTIILSNDHVVYTYIRDGETWREQDELNLPGKSTYIVSDLSPNGTTLALLPSRGKRHFSRGRIYYQRRKSGWEKIDLPDEEVRFSSEGSLALIGQTVYANINDSWQPKQTFEGVSVRLMGNGELIIVNGNDIYMQKPGYVWQKTQRLEGSYFNASSPDCAILIRDQGIFTRQGSTWYLTQDIPKSLNLRVNTHATLDCLTLYTSSTSQTNMVYAIPADALQAASRLSSEQWEFIDKLHYAQGEGLVLLDAEQRALFRTLPKIIRDQILKKWRVGSQEVADRVRAESKKRSAQQADNP